MCEPMSLLSVAGWTVVAIIVAGGLMSLAWIAAASHVTAKKLSEFTENSEDA